MIEQIYTYFTIEMIYFWLNLGILPFWVVLIIFPQSQICRVFTASIFPIFILSLVYGYLLYINFHNNYEFLKNFELYLGFAKLSNLFSESTFLILYYNSIISFLPNKKSNKEYLISNCVQKKVKKAKKSYLIKL